MEILLSLLPAFFFGPLGMTLVLVGGTVKQQLVGELSGSLIVALAIIPFMAQTTSMKNLLMAFCSGMLCAIGIAGQLYSFSLIGVSRTMPISTGLQLLYMTLAGVVIFSEWPTKLSATLGTTAIVCIAWGIYLTSYAEKQRMPSFSTGTRFTGENETPQSGLTYAPKDTAVTEKPSPFASPLISCVPLHTEERMETCANTREADASANKNPGNDIKAHLFFTANNENTILTPIRKALLVNLISALFLAGYVVWMRVLALEFGQFFPAQAAGMTACALVIAAFWNDGSHIFSSRTLKLTLGPGILYGLAILLMQISTQVNGVATGFTLSQLGVVISVLTGIVILKERKTTKETWATALGVLFILVGAFLIGYTKSLVS